MNTKEELLNEILAKRFEVEWCLPHEKECRSLDYLRALDKASQELNLSVEKIEKAIMLSRYPTYRRERLKNEMPNIPGSMPRV
jgi:hypothetical protein